MIEIVAIDHKYYYVNKKPKLKGVSVQQRNRATAAGE